MQESAHKHDAQTIKKTHARYSDNEVMDDEWMTTVMVVVVKVMMVVTTRTYIHAQSRVPMFGVVQPDRDNRVWKHSSQAQQKTKTKTQINHTATKTQNAQSMPRRIAHDTTATHIGGCNL